MADQDDVIRSLAQEFYNAVSEGLRNDFDMEDAFITEITAEEDNVLLRAAMAEDNKILGCFAPRDPGTEDFVALAEIHAAVLTRTGKEDFLKACVPDDAKTEDIRQALEEKIPSLARLCR